MAIEGTDFSLARLEEALSHHHPLFRGTPLGRLFLKVMESHDTLLRCGDSDHHMLRVARIARRFAREAMPIDWREMMEDQASVLDHLDRLPRVGVGYMLKVACAHLSLARKARAIASRSYVEHSKGSGLGLSLDEDVRRAQRRLPWHRFETSVAFDTAVMVRRMTRLMASYRRQLSYTVGLADLAVGIVTSMKGLCLMQASTLERLLLKRDGGTWDQLLLGEEFDHISRTLAGGTMKSDGDRGGVTPTDNHVSHTRWNDDPSRDSTWRQTYSRAEFAITICHAELWDGGWMLGRTLEKLELEVAQCLGLRL